VGWVFDCGLFRFDPNATSSDDADDVALRFFARQVYMAKEIATGDIVALKKVRMDNEREGVCLFARDFEPHIYIFL
jgi:hypothetical protein